MITTTHKQKILTAILSQRAKFEGSDAKYATSLGINKGIYARLKKGEIERVLSDAKWIHIARKLDVNTGSQSQWKTAKTAVFNKIYQQLSYCQQQGISSIFCDKADIGKTHTAKDFVKENNNAIYIDCSQCKSKQKLVRAIALEFGVDSTGKYSDVYADLIYYLKSIDKPIIILDEAGDLDYGAFLELKALWNATENYCGWYMMGADGLEAKINRAIGNKKVGYTEIFRRYGSKYQKATPLVKEERDVFIQNEIVAIIKANGVQPTQELVLKCRGSLTRVKIEISKLKKAA